MADCSPKPSAPIEKTKSNQCKGETKNKEPKVGKAPSKGPIQHQTLPSAEIDQTAVASSSYMIRSPILRSTTSQTHTTPALNNTTWPHMMRMYCSIGSSTTKNDKDNQLELDSCSEVGGHAITDLTHSSNKFQICEGPAPPHVTRHQKIRITLEINAATSPNAAPTPKGTTCDYCNQPHSKAYNQTKPLQTTHLSPSSRKSFPPASQKLFPLASLLFRQSHHSLLPLRTCCTTSYCKLCPPSSPHSLFCCLQSISLPLLFRSFSPSCRAVERVARSSMAQPEETARE